MKIDISKATIEWLEAWKADALTKPQNSFYRQIKITQVEAYRRFIMDKLDIYFSDCQISHREVTISVGEVYRDGIKQLLRAEFILEDGIAVIDSIASEIFYEPYCDDPSTRVVITFRIQK